MIDEREIKPNIPVKIPSKDGCEANITDVPFPVPFPKGLVYAPPARGTWTIAHSPMLIPGCHEIYVCCPCCLHGVVLSADEIPDGGPTPLEEAASRSEAELVRAALARLPDRDRRAILLRYWEGRSQQEVAAAIGTAEGTAKRILSRARATLRPFLEHLARRSEP